MWKMRGVCLFSISDGRLWDRGVFAAAAGSGKPPISKVPLLDHQEHGQERQYTAVLPGSCSFIKQLASDGRSRRRKA